MMDFYKIQYATPEHNFFSEADLSKCIKDGPVLKCPNCNNEWSEQIISRGESLEMISDICRNCKIHYVKSIKKFK